MGYASLEESGRGKIALIGTEMSLEIRLILPEGCGKGGD